MAAQCQVAIDDKVKEAVAGKVSAAPGQKHSRHYECSICINPAFDTPVRATCGHLYHQECLEHWLQGKVGDAHCCPDCRKELPPGRAAFTIDFVSKSVLDEVEVECPQDCAQSPAAKRMRFDVLGDHVRMHCPNTNLICSGEGCGAVLPRLQMIQGHLPSCKHVLVLCEQCDTSVKRGAMQEHMTRTCSHRRVPCEQCKQGTMPFHKQQEHKAKCTGPIKQHVEELFSKVHALAERAKKAERERDALKQAQPFSWLWGNRSAQ
eukprot:TRINITY_DN3082_c0_g1_i2.p2 TRINITY_DN3082_c0_g1~~TRINITY_DN3082_c0_g1_i2.p2  ORF type:complete len:293 (+),score=117.30 TRINITY_DN3082_c0_g1_i2:91-879(+)